VTDEAALDQAATDNPDLPRDFIAGVLEAMQESRDRLPVPYVFGVQELHAFVASASPAPC
jgi:hypothetical protein